MHHRAVPEPFYVRIEALGRTSPAHLANLLVDGFPLIEAMQAIHQEPSISRAVHIHQSAAKVDVAARIDGQMHEVEEARKTKLIQ